ncbi:hypothetical protein GALL_437920 [mine drainage metagenome]|uniref:Sel1 repeat family protein n=1 Tax=mine drainage metagenome TaxID=410659 RepID=A0A1J5QAM8_9ZZZZ
MDGDGTELEKAWAAYNRQDYLTARLIWEALAYRGDVIARYNLGVMYRIGLGVPQDHELAAHWDRKAGGDTHRAQPGLVPFGPPSVDHINRLFEHYKISPESEEEVVTKWEGKWRYKKDPHPRDEVHIRSARLWWEQRFEMGRASFDPNEASADNIQRGLAALGVPQARWWESVIKMEQGAREEGRKDLLKAIAVWRLRQQLL